MVSFPPLFPSSRWWARFLDELKSASGIPEAVVSTNARIASPKEFGRFVLADAKGREMMLSVAVVGGGRQLRTFDKLPCLNLSEHGDWRKIHLGALESLLGRKPFFRHIEPKIREIYSNRDIRTLREFNSAIFHCLLAFLMGNMKAHDIQLFHQNPMLQIRGKEIATKLAPDISIIEALADFGRETLLGILAFDCN